MITRTEMIKYSFAIDDYAAGVTSSRKGRSNGFIGGDADDVVTNYTSNTKIICGKGDNSITSIGGSCYIDSGDGDDYVVAVGMGTDIKLGGGYNKLFAQGSEITIDRGTGSTEAYLAGSKIRFMPKIGHAKDIIKSAAFTFDYVKNKGLIVDAMYVKDFYDYQEVDDTDEEPETDENIEV